MWTHMGLQCYFCNVVNTKLILNLYSVWCAVITPSPISVWYLINTTHRVNMCDLCPRHRIKNDLKQAYLLYPAFCICFGMSHFDTKWSLWHEYMLNKAVHYQNMVTIIHDFCSKLHNPQGISWWISPVPTQLILPLQLGPTMFPS